MKVIKNTLWICLGNTARSPVAEFLARHYAKKYNIDLISESAGFINAFSYMQPESRHFLKSKGISSKGFKPQLITRGLLEKQDLILTMEKSHKDDIISTYGNIEKLKEKIFTLKEFNGETEDLDIIDPYYTSSATYKRVMDIIDRNVEKAIKKIVKLSSSL